MAATNLTYNKIRHSGFDLDFYPHFLSEKLAGQVFAYLESILSHSPGRKATLVGDRGLLYRIEYRGATSAREVHDWSEIKGMSQIKALVDSTMDDAKDKATVCIIQRYHDGRAGIDPHRDREMVPGTRICGISLGATRKMVFSRRGYDDIEIELSPGSMYVMNDPTNQYWAHSVVKDPTVTQPRISLTFRNYVDPKQSDDDWFELVE